MTGAEIVIERAQGCAPQSFPWAIEVFVAQVPSQFAGGLKFVLTPGKLHAAELTVHLLGNEHVPGGASHEHVPHESGPGAGWPSKTRFGASSGHDGASNSMP